MAVNDAQINAAFDRSNIEPSYRDYQSKVLEGALSKVNLPASEVLALSLVEMSLKPDGTSMGTKTMLLIVFKSGIAMAEQKGVLNKRIDLQSISYQSNFAVTPDEKNYTPTRGEIAIQGLAGRTVPVFRIGWNWSQGGRTSALAAGAERDRILGTILRAMQGDWDSPPSGQANTVGDGNSPAARHGTGGSQPDAASQGHGRPPGALPSKREYLITWTAGVFREAGVTPVQDQVVSVARMAAMGLFMERVVAFANARPLPALLDYCRNLPGDMPDRLDQFDEIYTTWIRLVTESDAHTQDPADPTYARIRTRHIELIDQSIDRFLAASRNSFIEGVRGDFG